MSRRKSIAQRKPYGTGWQVPVLRATTLAIAALALQLSPLVGQTRTITGRVVSAANGEGLAGAEVAVGTGVAVAGRAVASTISGANGAFSLSVDQGEVSLTVRMIGFRNQTVNVGAGQNNVQIELETDPFRLDEIVVTGQATGVQRRNLANAVSTVSAEQLNVVPTSSIETQLAGKVAGADIQQNSGAPGGGIQVNLRGVSTIFGNATPLYVVDGVVVSDAAVASGANTITNAQGGTSASMQDNPSNRIADLNPADIESIEILKGGSAAAIYGSKANNGVILITTKRGRAGETQFSLTQRVGISRLANKLGTRTYSSVAEAVETLGPSAEEYLSQFGGQLPGPFDLEEQLAGGNAPAYETAVSMSGGNDQTRFYASGLFHTEDGVVTGTYYDKYTMALNLDQNLGDRVAVELRTSAQHTNTGRGFSGNDNTSTTYYVTLSGTPSFIDLRKRDGDFPTNIFSNSNPLETAEFVQNDESVYRFIGSLRGTWDVFRGDQHSFRLLAQGGADAFNLENIIYAPEDVQFECLGAGCTPTDQRPGASVNGRTNSRQFNAGLNAVHSFTSGSGFLTATTSAGVQYEYRNFDLLRVQSEDLFPGQQNVGQAVQRIPEQERERSKDLGIYLQEEVLFGERLLLTGSVRSDRSSNNVQTDKWFYYPKVAGSYRFLLGAGPLEELKLRAAWGQSGLQPLYGDKFTVLNPGAIGGRQTLALGNTVAAPDLRPERQTEVEGGVDATLFGGRATLEFTAYHQRVDDLILTRTLAPSTGYANAVFNNDGWMTNRGIEAALRGVAVQTGGFTWTTGATFSLDRSKMDSLSVPAFNAPGAGFGTSIAAGRIEQGRSLTQLVGRDTITVADDPRCLEFLSAEPGDGQCVPGTRIETQLGDANPDFRMGLSNDFRWKSLSLTTTLDWQQGGVVNNLLGWLFDLSSNSADFTDPCNLEGCQEGETLGEYRLRVYPARTSTVFLEDASFVKLREVALSWQVPQSLLQNTFLTGLDAARVTLSGRNLLRITDYKGMDPEVHNFGNTAIRTNIDVGPYPPSRSFWLSVDVRF